MSIDPSKRYESNPFISKGGITTPIAKKQVTITPFKTASNSSISIINQGTGEMMGTAVVTYKRVDSGQFIKLFAENIGLAFELTSAGIKALNVVIWSVQKTGMNIDRVTLDKYVLGEFLHANKERNLKLSEQTYKRGIGELCKSGIIAKALRKADYFINPYFMFNGDRLAFATVIQKGTPIPSPDEFKLIGQTEEELQASAE